MAAPGLRHHLNSESRTIASAIWLSTPDSGPDSGPDPAGFPGPAPALPAARGRVFPGSRSGSWLRPAAGQRLGAGDQLQQLGGDLGQIGRADGSTPVTNAHLVCSFL